MSGIVRAARMLLALAFLAATPAVASAAPLVAPSLEFGTPTAEARYGQSITFDVPVTVTAPLDRVELRLRFPDTIGPAIFDVDPPGGTGSRTLTYTLELGGGSSLTPNTTIEATWVAYPSGGGAPVESRPVDVTYADTSVDWRTVTGDLVRVHWYEGSEDFARRALAIGEKAVSDTAKLLGVTEDRPIDFFIYADEAKFRTALGPATRENVGGQAHADIRTLFALITPDAIDAAWVGIVIPHELVHLVFDTAVRNPYRFPPRWLNEGLAVYLSEGYGPSDRGRVEDAVRARELIPLTALTGQFPTDADKTYLAYAESVSAIDHLVSAHGRDTLISLVLAYRDGLTDDQAFTKAVGQDLAAFQAEWLADLGAAPPVEYGPRPAPAGPLPPGWSGPGQTPGPGATPGAATGAPATPAPTAAPGAAGAGSGGGSLLAALLALGVVAVLVVGLVAARRRPPAVP